VVPDHPKMGPMIVSLMRHLERAATHSRRDVEAS
jgi:hypothetical protein